MRGIHCILPPHVLKNIAQKGSPRQRARAMRTLSTDQTLRSLRAAEPRAKAFAARAKRIAPDIEGRKQRTIFDCRGVQGLPGEVVRTENSPLSKDAAVNDAFNALGATFDFFWDVFERNSIDDEGLALNASVHFGSEYDNAFWDGERMVFGDGDGDIFKRFTLSLDVVGHELVHGIIEVEGPLSYFFQSGALNESLSDVFGSLVKQYAQKQKASEANWLIGEGLFAPGVQGVALRSLKAPGTAFDDAVLGKDPQPSHMESFVHTFEDNGGVHVNSGIPNHAFYSLAANLGGYAWEKAGRIWYETLRDSQLGPNSGFRRFSRSTFVTAQRLYGANSDEAKAVRDAWGRVGLKAA